MPFDHKGIFSSVWYNQTTSGTRYDSVYIIYSNGFMLSGVNENSFWINSQFSGGLFYDYLPGSYQSSKNDSLKVIYKVSKHDSPFGESWQKYKGAVIQGADFYDGNNDGVYKPIDLNKNGKWDTNEDMPYIFGEETYVFTYHDGAPKSERRFDDQNPQGIEITNYVYHFKNDMNLNNIIFVRYQIKNTGIVAEKFDSVYFGVFVDPDIGVEEHFYQDDLSGCDTINNLAFTYSAENDTPDSSYALVSQLLQTPIVKSQNPNSYAVDYTPVAKIDTLRNYKNQKMNSYYNSLRTRIWDYEGGDTFYFRNKLIYGGVFEDYGPYENTIPCYWNKGEFYGIDCDQVDPNYVFSGDPIQLEGWVDNSPSDKRYIQSTGPFELEVGKSQNILIVYNIGKGTSPLEALKDAKIRAKLVNTYYADFIESNYFQQELEAQNKTENINYDFVLYQNYPNPFNLSTTIKLNIEGNSKSIKDESKNVVIKVYDILGREVKTLLDKKLQPGVYEIEFDGSNLNSGIYIYRVRQGAKFLQNKMLLLK